MTIRVYSDRVGSVDKWSFERKRELILLERKNVSKVIAHEDLKLLLVYSGEQEEQFRYDECAVEIMEKEPDDGLTEGLFLPY